MNSTAAMIIGRLQPSSATVGRASRAPRMVPTRAEHTVRPNRASAATSLRWRGAMKLCSMAPTTPEITAVAYPNNSELSVATKVVPVTAWMWLVLTLASFMGSPFSSGRGRGAGRAVDGQADVERRALADLGLEVQRAAVLIHHHAARDGEPLPRALAHFLGGEERIEDTRAHVHRDALAGIRDGDFHLVVE